MELTDEIMVQRTTKSRLPEVDFNKLGFGNYISDHMLICYYKNGQWETPSIVPFGDISLSPATLALHYGQSVFEGLKAFRLDDGRVNLFRVQKHYERMLRSLSRMCMPGIPEEIFVEGLRRLIEVDKDWLPTQPGGALYVRPIMFASEAKYGVKISDEYCFIMFTGPVGSYFSNPLRLKVETDFTRAAKGGTGSAKCAGNYGGAYYPTQKAKEAGFDQVLWTDARENKYIEESGMMNAMFVIDGVLVTPPTSDSILAGVTRDSLLTLADDLGIPNEARPIAITELENAFRHNTISEAFGAGTAAVVAPIATIHLNGIDHHLPAYNDNSIMFQLKNRLEAIRKCQEEDKHGWNFLF
ncbi:branched chain amino acid aminotransferase [Niastella koreensis]|uniref:branched-chain-amino-acid transaminase n=2 Tax=Niastella koreensis TaxID=354356 RepID=G8TNW4_NIAKG|nr:branched-chain amino acid aminotransferase [Niastella koreensis]AEW02049.1 branched-chain amino acid aminotransferase [Niastella koreensis GR20-10]OQP48740.1 branched chain amino acid aminotransferase [Niastella koreensis]